MFILSCYLIVKFTAPGTEVEPFLFGKKEEGQIWPNSENVSFLRFIAVCRPYSIFNFIIKTTRHIVTLQYLIEYMFYVLLFPVHLYFS